MNPNENLPGAQVNPNPVEGSPPAQPDTTPQPQQPMAQGTATTDQAPTGLPQVEQPQTMQQPAIMPSQTPGMASPQQPVAPLPAQPYVPPMQQQAPGMPGQPVTQNQMNTAPKKSGVRKILTIAGISLVSLFVLLVAAGTVMRMLGGGVPKYSETKELKLAGSSGVENSGMTVQIPVEMEEYTKTDLSATYQHKADKDDSSKGTYGAIATDIQTVSFSKDITQEQIDQVTQAFNSSEFDKSAIPESSFYKNVKITNKTVTDNGRKMRADVNFEIQSVDDSNVFKPGQGAIIIHIDNARVYSTYYLFIQEVFDANKDFWPKLEDSIKVSQ